MNGQTRVVSLEAKKSETGARVGLFEDEFLTLDDFNTVKAKAAERALDRSLSDIDELMSEARWEDLLALFHPVEEKVPELVENRLDLEVRARVAFALGQIKRFDEAIEALKVCVTRDPENFHYHSSLAYTAYNSLYAARNKEIFLSGNPRRERMELAHTHFKQAQSLRPNGVTNFYREGMLFRQIERKTDQSLPLFEKAVANWDVLDEEQKKTRHQEKKNFVKALYQFGSASLETGKAKAALKLVKRCLDEDHETNHVSALFKYFALGKVQFHLNAFPEARDALVFAIERRSDEPFDFVCELLAKTYLAMGQTDQAMKAVARVPEKLRRPYYRWTEADVFCALRDFQGARRVLALALERDRRSRHKTLMRLARIEYAAGDFEACGRCGEEACSFFNEKWGATYNEGTFWRAASAYRLGRLDEAMALATELQQENPRYPKLGALLYKIRAGKEDIPRRGTGA
jgi:tetratricopeptide (TPR) repeat protein